MKIISPTEGKIRRKQAKKTKQTKKKNKNRNDEKSTIEYWQNKSNNIISHTNYNFERCQSLKKLSH